MSNKKEQESLFNLNIKLEGWKGPFDDFDQLERMAGLVKSFNEAGDKFRVVRQDDGKGRLHKGYEEGLVTYMGKIDLNEKISDIHVHYRLNGTGRGFNRIFIEKIFNEDNGFFLDDAGVNPRYTLEGLYGTLKDERINTKINALVGELEKHASFDSSVILNTKERKKETKLKLLENKYKNLILK